MGWGIGRGMGVAVDSVVGVDERVVELVEFGVAVVVGVGMGAVFRNIFPYWLGVGDCAVVPHLPVSSDNPE